jgi:hypothetical protein
MNTNTAASAPTLNNTDGFWLLTFFGRTVAIPQHQALFYICWLLRNPSQVPITASDLAAAVLDLFGAHPDFKLAVPWLESDRVAAVVDIITRRRRALEAEFDALDQGDPDAAGLDEELDALEDLQLVYTSEFARANRCVTEVLSASIFDLLSSLTLARDQHGQPHELLRAFARHLFLYLLAPSIRTSGPGPLTHLLYCPPES